ncbi:MAG: Vps62-related protein [Thermoplasmatales archaeon]|nr:MAG: Vps62-related protein [Thermoplasmatales archaeon]
MRKLLKFSKKIFANKIFCIAFIALFVLSCVNTVSADDEELAQQYAPIFHFEKDETCFPVDVSYHLENSNLKGFGDQYSNISIPPAELNFSNLSSIFSENDIQFAYLDNTKGSVDDDNIINDYQSSGFGYTVYSHVYTNGVETTIQYWMFYAFNKGELNQHEGDWEMVQITLSSGTPIMVAYSQHHSGQSATWDQVEKDGDHIKVYVARGSHANYLRYYSGKFGIASDIVGKNGEIITQENYYLELLESQEWLNFPGMWGEFTSAEDYFLGRTGPQGPKYRGEGNMWVGWGENLIPTDNNIFLIEWIVYHFVILFFLFSAIFLCITGFRIYRRHKKYGLGPRIVSMLYIDGFNLKSIGNILCFVSIIIVIFALFNPWYGVSYSISGDIGFEAFNTGEMMNLIEIDGINGIQITVPGENGPVPMGAVSLPFSFFIGIGLVFLVFAAIGISKSGKLGRKYLWKGIRFLIPIVILLIAIMAMGALVSNMIPEMGGTSVGDSIGEVIDGLSNYPLGGDGTIFIVEEGIEGQIYLQWGLGTGGQFLLIAGIVMILAAILEIAARTTFFESKIPEKPKKLKRKQKENTSKKSEEQTKDKKE